MKNGIKILIAMIFLFVILINSCDTTNNPVSSDDTVDPLLLGEWYRIDTLSNSVPGPDIVMSGIQINADQSIKKLGIETSTGRVAISTISNYKKLIKANDGIVILEYLAQIGLVADTFSYSVVNESLDLLNISKTAGHISGMHFNKTELNRQLADPINSYLGVKIDNKICENSKVYKHPSAFIIKNSTSELELTGVIQDTVIQISISDFNGINTYDISYQKGILQCKDGDYYFNFVSDSVTTGIIVIEEYNEENNVCSGQFSFAAIRYDYFDKQIHKKNLTEGVFSVPIYK